MEKAISEIVGRARLKGGESTKLYRALRMLMCATCGAEISVGMIFTRRKVKGIGLRIMPQCQKCAPFTLQADRKEKSALLQSLLTESPRDSSGRAKDSSEKASQAEMKDTRAAKEVRRRLGPALKRGRKPR